MPTTQLMNAPCPVRDAQWSRPQYRVTALVPPGTVYVRCAFVRALAKWLQPSPLGWYASRHVRSTTCCPARSIAAAPAANFRSSW